MNAPTTAVTSLPRYRVLQSNSVVELEAQVNRLLAEGWQTQGGLSIAYLGTAGHIKFYQAMSGLER